MNRNGLSFVICPTHKISAENQAFCDRVFLFWEKMWKQTFFELGITTPLHSDCYVNSDFATVILENEQIISMSLYKVFNTRAEAFKNFSYFTKWGPTVEQLLEYAKIFNCTYFCVRDDYRTRKYEGLAVKQMNLSLLLKAFIHSDIPAMAATPRRDRNMHKLLYEWGGTCLLENQPSGYGDMIDLVVYRKPDVEAAFARNTPSLITQLWENRKTIPFDKSDFDLIVPTRITPERKTA